jgi:hypothetical protein
VHDSLRKTFANSSIEPSAKLHNAQKSVDFNNPKANEIIRDLGPKLKDGINVLMEAAKHEHYDIKVLKHLLVTASFAKKFVEPHEQTITDAYVNLVKYSIVYTRLRHSDNLPRLITTTQAEKFKHKNLLKMCMKYRDYAMALELVEQMNMRHLLSTVYEEWCQNMIRYSKQSEATLIQLFKDRFIHLAKKMAVD